jgi:putative Mg2+ transporter-C (MgtC) family protein
VLHMDFAFTVSIAVRLVIACLLGGVIGYERESTHRPAGFRTHILVCVGSALVMVTSDFIFQRYQGQANVDPARLGAQVISGIGFLGAGTIIREGFHVKGLTTAASLWAVSCVGIAVGIGFFEGAIAATILIYLTLILLKRMEDHFRKKNSYRHLYIQTDESGSRIPDISKVFEKHLITVRSIEFISEGNDNYLTLKYLVRLPTHRIPIEVMEDLLTIEGVRKAYEE